MTSRSLIKVLKEARSKARFSQEEVADRANISFRTYQRIESGETSPRLDVLFRLFNALHIQAKEFFIGQFIAEADGHNLTPTISREQGWDSKPVSGALVLEDVEIEALKKILNDEFEAGKGEQGYWEWNVDSQEFYLSAQMYKIYELEYRDDGTARDFRERISDEDLKKIDADLEALITKGVPYDNTHSVNYNGDIFKVRSVARLYRTKANQRVVFGVAMRLSPKTS